METVGRVRMKKRVKILPGEITAVENLSGEREKMWKEKHFRGRINRSWGLIGCKGKEESGFLIRQLESHLLG